MSYIPFSRATTAQRIEIIANDIERLNEDVNQMVDTGDLTLCKLLKVQAMMRDLQTKAKIVSIHAE
ncbi:hypothetical protein ABC030_004324 [Escherichia coli]|uniref:hypothetical protein n=1 Tax=Escherichia TaxID=561 RepID=UPI0005A5FC6E|nr:MULTISPECIES: hypothetical protein [Escherichia]ECF1690150.1 hypothetical protein [Salmonella enterica subsp. enterica serovar Bareilly]ECG2546030.1 hypothetical protein [Salmonella enterica subsp. enterica serovar Neukoelln]EFX7209229.1 hypothetical protein [Shigella sonnei]EFY0418092.1 hypothetical protein [Shigella boydii]EEQ4562071.1 hypothetical protein [Escherichia coli]